MQIMPLLSANYDLSSKVAPVALSRILLEGKTEILSRTFPVKEHMETCMCFVYAKKYVELIIDSGFVVLGPRFH